MSWEPHEIEWKEWWCPTRQQWVSCDDDCPNGTEHTESRINKSMGLRWTGPAFATGAEALEEIRKLRDAR